MAASARIDELRSKFEENPRRYFAPLANEYRKSGDLGTAIALLRTQLRQFPQHMSGHVVLGQALFEAGELEEARRVFERAVELDAENLIALRHLGDISRELGDTERARSWYRRVLDVDPYNEQIASLIAEPAAPTTSVQPATATDVAGLTEVWPQPTEPAPQPTDEPHPTPEPTVEESSAFIDLAEDDFLAWAPPAAMESGPAPMAESEPVPELDVVPPAPEPIAPRLDAVDAATFDPVVGLDLVPLHDQAFEQLEHVVEHAPPEPAPPEPAAPVQEPPVEPPTAQQTPELESVASEAPAAWIPEEGAPLELVTSDAFATETMAELCLEQGHDEEALAIYERLVAQRPGDATLAERAHALRERLHPAAPTASEPTASEPTASEPAAPEPAAPEPAAAESNGQVDERDAWAADAWAGALRANVPAGEPLLAPRSTEAIDDLSFDRFFAGAEFVDEPVAAAPPPAPSPEPATLDRAAAEPLPRATPAPSATPVSPASPVPEEEDLAEFNAWLKGLRDS